jgi:hypothetical protein
LQAIKIFLVLRGSGAYRVKIAIVAIDVLYVAGDAADALAWALRRSHQHPREQKHHAEDIAGQHILLAL